MTKKMLIDATHPEETRVVVVDGNKLEEFDFEAATRRQLIGNIYLAKVTRVEPSLQAAFVEYGGNRHGFLAFNEIHPDYYQIPVADRQALLEQQAAAERSAAEREQENGEDLGNGEAPENGSATVEAEEPNGNGGEANGTDVLGEEEEAPGPAEAVSLGPVEPLEEIARPRPYRRSYKIQEVIKKRQILLVQVMKDERGTKGAALTTYLSLPGRYCVLMPNTARGGGISRKITKPVDRKKLKSIAAELEVPEGMGLIIRTAGANRTKAEIKRDFESLLRLWEDIRDRTLRSSAPTLIYEEGNLIKRAIRDLYSKDIESITVEGEDGYREAKTFMRMLMPSHAKNVQLYKGRVPLFQRHGVETQIYAMFNPVVQLKSGGYIVFDPTEALVAIDVNSGKSTREHNIEATAFNTNMEAAEEVARQLRLRDLAGLIVIDFIDMEENRNIRNVERKLKDCLKNDRARIQVGRISAFGLMEMSRQRLRTGVVETTTQPCPHCHGTGLIRSVESTALHILRSVEEECLKGRAAEIAVTAPVPVALYILNQKRAWLRRIEEDYEVAAVIAADALMVAPDFRIERTRIKEIVDTPVSVLEAPADELPTVPELEEDAEEVADEEDAEAETETAEAGAEARDDDGKRRRKRRRRRRKQRGEPEDAQDLAPSLEAALTDADYRVDEESAEESDEAQPAEPAFDEAEAGAEVVEVEASDEQPARRRRRGEGRGRSRRPRRSKEAEAEAPAADASSDLVAEEAQATDGEAPAIPASAADPIVEIAGGGASAEVEDRPDPVPAVDASSHEAGLERDQPVEAEGPQATQEGATEPGFGRPDAVLPTAELVEPQSPELDRTEAEATDGSGKELVTADGSDSGGEQQDPDTAPEEPAEPERPRGQRRGWWQRRLLGS